jgi:hypothetical protein
LHRQIQIAKKQDTPGSNCHTLIVSQGPANPKMN